MERRGDKKSKGKAAAKQYARHGNRVQAMTEQELRRLVEESTEKYTIYYGRVMTSEAIKHLKNHAIVHIVDKLPGGGKKKGQKEQDKGETSFELMTEFQNFIKARDEEWEEECRELKRIELEKREAKMAQQHHHSP